MPKNLPSGFKIYNKKRMNSEYRAVYNLNKIPKSD